LVNAGLLHTRLGGYAEGQQAFRQAEALFETLGDLRGQAVSALNLGMVAFFQGEYTEAQAAAQRGLELARRMNSPAMEANALANLGAAERELGNLAAAIAHMEAGLSQHRKLEQLAEVGTDLCDLTVAYLRCGDLEAARLAAEEMLELHRRAPDTMMHPQYMLWMAGETCQALGDTQRARELYRQAHAILMEKAAAIPEPVFRETFLQLPFNRPICAAFAPTPHF
jgi:tetratricopeptide (TPR) repeat protein